MPYVLTVTVSGWTTGAYNVSPIQKQDWMMTVDRAKVLRFHVKDRIHLSFIREAIIVMERDWSGLNVSSHNDFSDLTVKFDVSKYNLSEVVELIGVAASRASKAFVSIH
jgi:hypothetical protein